MDCTDLFLLWLLLHVVFSTVKIHSTVSAAVNKQAALWLVCYLLFASWTCHNIIVRCWIVPQETRSSPFSLTHSRYNIRGIKCDVSHSLAGLDLALHTLAGGSYLGVFPEQFQITVLLPLVHRSLQLQKVQLGLIRGLLRLLQSTHLLQTCHYW